MLLSLAVAEVINMVLGEIYKNRVRAEARAENNRNGGNGCGANLRLKGMASRLTNQARMNNLRKPNGSLKPHFIY